MCFCGCFVHNVYLQYHWGLCISQILQVLYISHMIFGSKQAMIWYHKQSWQNGVNLDGTLLGLTLTTQSQNPSVFPRKLPAHPIHSYQLHLIKIVFFMKSASQICYPHGQISIKTATPHSEYFSRACSCSHFFILRISCKKKKKKKNWVSWDQWG